jgi:hypothetical protein
MLQKKLTPLIGGAGFLAKLPIPGSQHNGLYVRIEAAYLRVFEKGINFSIMNSSYTGSITPLRAVTTLWVLLRQHFSPQTRTSSTIGYLNAPWRVKQCLRVMSWSWKSRPCLPHMPISSLLVRRILSRSRSSFELL